MPSETDFGETRWVSTTDQDFSIQQEKLAAAGCTIVRAEKVSGTSTEGRDELKTLLQFLREGDTLVVPGSTDWRGRCVTCRTSRTN
jgi:DNA invertase Pin-like site-specific DNA recombinase